jgi:acylphosphatase
VCIVLRVLRRLGTNVACRSFTQKQAKSIGVTGFVTNASDGSVGTI